MKWLLMKEKCRAGLNISHQELIGLDGYGFIFKYYIVAVVRSGITSALKSAWYRSGQVPFAVRSEFLDKHPF